MSYLSLALGEYATTPMGSGGEWSGWRKLLTTDATGALCNWNEAFIGDLTIGDSYSVQLSGPTIPDTTLVSAVLTVDTQAGAQVFEVNGTFTADGEAGTYAVGFFLIPDQTNLLSLSEYTWSIVIANSAGDRWTPVDQSPLIPN